MFLHMRAEFLLLWLQCFIRFHLQATASACCSSNILASSVLSLFPLFFRILLSFSCNHLSYRISLLGVGFAKFLVLVFSSWWELSSSCDIIFLPLPVLWLCNESIVGADSVVPARALILFISIVFWRHCGYIWSVGKYIECVVRL